MGQWMRWSLLAAVVGATLTGLAGCDDGVNVSQTPALQFAPPEFRFPKLQPGQSIVREVVVTNGGSGDLILGEIRLEDDSTAGELELFVRGADGQLGSVPREVTLSAVRYSPTDAEATADRGAVRLRTNDADNEAPRIPIASGDIGAEIFVNPQTLDFESVEAGQTAVRQLTITNLGQVELVVSRLDVSGSQDFGARFQDRSVTGDLGENPLVVPQGESILVDVTYSPPTLGPDTGELKITTNDTARPTVTVNLRANGAAPCIQVVPESVDFGSALMVPGTDVETPNTRPLVIESCGTTPLRVTGLAIANDDGTFRVLTELTPDDETGALFELPARNPDDPVPPSRELQIGFWPVESRAYGNRLLVTSNVSDEPFPVDLFGRGVDNACPIPAARETDLHVQPLDIITLDGTPSSDPGGEVRKWRWTVVDRPQGSVSVPVESFADPRRPADGGEPDDETTPQALFFVDLAGQYTIELQVVDNLGQTSCEPKAVERVVVDAVPDKDLHVQLVWSTPEDPDETDNKGTDVDLHVRHQNAGEFWSDSVWDCYFRNINPDWGAQGDVVDNPTLDIDDTNGAGPENVNLSRPEPGVTYDIGAIYFRSESTFGDPERDPRQEHSSLVTVRVYAKGELLAEWVDRELERVAQLWWVASVEWCDDASRCPVVVPRDEVFEEGQYQTAASP
jgi:hypothetical protein